MNLPLAFGGVQSIGYAVLVGLYFWRRQWAILLASLAAVFLLQTGSGIAILIYAAMSLYLASVTWVFTRADGQGVSPDDRLTLAFVVVLVLVQAAVLTSYKVLAVVAVALPVAIGLPLLVDRLLRNQTIKLGGMIAGIVILFIILKSALFEIAADRLSALATASWFGFSYIAFRLIHTLRERQLGRLPTLGLRQYLSYVFFFPALPAGPIDRVERFVTEYEKSYSPTEHSVLVESGYRIVMGLTKKYIIADTLGLIALNASNAADAGTLWTWVQVYSYAFQIFFDFSGYTDMAIGVGLLLGIKLPENFNRPYTRRNLALFWQSWHMTLSNWVRFYVFSPLSRSLIRTRLLSSLYIQVFISQVVTMLIIGLWHGITANFVIWGLWHGIGLFVYKVWSDVTRQTYFNLRERPRLLQLWHSAGVILTFHFVSLGWVWFVLPDTGLAIDVLERLFGVS